MHRGRSIEPKASLFHITNKEEDVDVWMGAISGKSIVFLSHTYTDNHPPSIYIDKIKTHIYRYQVILIFLTYLVRT
jgi:hypothetical protein